MNKKISLILLVISFIPYAFILFCSLYTAVAGLDFFGEATGVNGFVTAFSGCTYLLWKAGVTPISLVYQLLYIAGKDKNKNIAGAVRFAVLGVVVMFVMTILFL